MFSILGCVLGLRCLSGKEKEKRLVEISEYGLYTAQYGFIWDRARYIVLQIQNYEF